MSYTSTASGVDEGVRLCDVERAGTGGAGVSAVLRQVLTGWLPEGRA